MRSMGIGHLDPNNLDRGEFQDLLKAVIEDDKLKLVPCAVYDSFKPDILRMFTHLSARYLLPTVELVDYLKRIIGDRKAIEIGSGCGDLARFLDIPATDNYCQEWPVVKDMYAKTGQPTIKYGENVERIDAAAAIEKYKPDVVLGAWVTQWIDPELPPPPGGGNVFGIKESEVIKTVQTYIVIGAEDIHKYKFILKEPHEVLDAGMVRSRRYDNRIWKWG